MKRLVGLILAASSVLYSQTAFESVSLINNESGFGIRAAAMGNAYSAVADDYSAIYWNPAGLAQMYDGQFSASLYHQNFNNSVNYFNTNLQGDHNFTELQNMGFAYPFPVVRGSFVLAFGYNKINNLDFFADFAGFSTKDNGLVFEYEDDTSIPFNQNVQQTFSVFQDGSISQWSFAGAIDLSRNFSAGLTLNFYSGDGSYLFEMLQEDTENNYSGFPDDFEYYNYRQRILRDFSGFEAKLGGLFRLNKNLRLGAVVSFPYTLTIDEEWSENDITKYDNIDEVDEFDLGSGTFDYQLEVPFKFSGGLSYSNNLVTISSSIDYRDWTQMKFDVPSDRDPDDYDELLQENRVFQEEYQDVLSYAFGGELKLLNNTLFLRGGYRFVPSPKKESNFTLRPQNSLFDTAARIDDRSFYSFGLGYRIDRNTDINFSYTTSDYSNATPYVYTGDNPSENITTNTILFGVNFNF